MIPSFAASKDISRASAITCGPTSKLPDLAGANLTTVQIQSSSTDQSDIGWQVNGRSQVTGPLVNHTLRSRTSRNVSLKEHAFIHLPADT